MSSRRKSSDSDIRGSFAALKRASQKARKLAEATGTHFVVMRNGKLVEKVSGKPLDRFAHDEVFAPLEMNYTTYTPLVSLRGRIAPTEKPDKLVPIAPGWYLSAARYCQCRAALLPPAGLAAYRKQVDATAQKWLADAEKKVPDPPSTSSAFPNGVSTESSATDPTTNSINGLFFNIPGRPPSPHHRRLGRRR